jgi:predicted transcriptional regulator
MATFTSSLPDDLLRQLAENAKALNLPKNKIIERALVIYLDQLKRANYKRSYSRAKNDADILLIAEEGMTDYLSQIEEDETK